MPAKSSTRSASRTSTPPKKKKAYGPQPRQSLSDLVLGRMVTVQTGKTNRYGHVVGRVSLEGRVVNLEQAKPGLAWQDKACARDQSWEDRRIDAGAESIVMDGLLGLWSAGAMPVPPRAYRHLRSPSPWEFCGPKQRSQKRAVFGHACAPVVPVRHQTVAMGVTGEPTAPGNRNGGAVSKNRWRCWARSQCASGVRCQISPR